MSGASGANGSSSFRFADLFAGIGGCRQAFENVGGQCVFTSEWNQFAQKTYKANFPDREGEHQFAGDITQVEASDLPPHDVLVAGFPCQPFSIAGVSKKNSLGRPHGFDDPTQGTLFFNVAQIIDKHRPKAFLLENVRNLESHDRGNTFRVIQQRLEETSGYHFRAKVLSSASLVPQRRQRIFMVGFDMDAYPEMPFSFDDVDLGDVSPTMKSVLHRRGDRSDEPYTDSLGRASEKYILTPRLWEYLINYKRKHRAAGNGFGYGLVGPNDVARTLSARYYKDGSEILVDRGRDQIPRKLTPRECARLMGFPEEFVIPVSDSQAYKQFGNSVVVPVVQAVAEQISRHL